MKQKERYTLHELFDNLPIPLTELSKLSSKSHGTLTRIRDGEPARRSTINKLLIILSKIYELELSIDNVDGIVLEGRQQEKPIAPIVESVENAPAQQKPIHAMPLPEKAPTSIVEPKRAYSPRKSNLPDGCILATEFGLAHDVKRETFRDHMNIGLGPGLIHGPDVPEDGTVLIKDYVRHEERNKRVRKDGTVETEKYLTPAQQKGAIEFWTRHKADMQVRKVAPKQCDNPDCPCHELKLGE